MAIPFIVDVSPVYDLLQGMALVARTPHGQSRWAAWAQQTASALERSQLQRLARWFRSESPLGVACVAITPTIAGEHDIPAFLAALERLPTPDFLRLMVSSGELAVAPPLAANDLLALVGHRRVAQAFVDRYIGLTGHQRSHLIQLVTEPEAARRELLGLLDAFAATAFERIEPELREERIAAGEQLTQARYRLPDAPPDWLSWIGEYSPAVLAPATLLGNWASAYYHELDRSLFDGMAYEPLISMVGAEHVLAPDDHSRPAGRLRAPALALSGQVERWAQAHAALGDPTRLRIIRLLMERPRYGQELAAQMGMSGATISHHVGELSKVGILRLERRGQRTYFLVQSEVMATLLDESRRYLFAGAANADDTGGETQITPKDEASS